MLTYQPGASPPTFDTLLNSFASHDGLPFADVLSADDIRDACDHHDVAFAEGPHEVRAVVGLPEGAEVIAYCHSGSRSALATLALRSAGYDARNYAGSWHEWSRYPELPLER